MVFLRQFVAIRHKGLRNDRAPREPAYKYQYLRKHPYLDFPRVWNSLPISLKTLNSKSLFKKKLKAFLLN